MYPTRYPGGVTGALLCALLLQSCQARLDVLQGGTLKPPPKPDVQEPASSSSLSMADSALNAPQITVNTQATSQPSGDTATSLAESSAVALAQETRGEQEREGETEETDVVQSIRVAQGGHGDEIHGTAGNATQGGVAVGVMTGGTINMRGPEGKKVAPQEVLQKLRNHYTDRYAQVDSLFKCAEESPKDVKKLAFTLQLIEPIDQHEKRTDSRNDIAAHREHKQRPRTLIAPEKLFQRRRTKPGGEEDEIKRVLVVGDPGIGKTSLSKQLAYRWAEGDLWKEEFKAVYVLPVRELQKQAYDNSNYHKNPTLPTAIVERCFTPPNEEVAYQALRDQVSKELEKPTTLVILDGLDERTGASEEILNQATAYSAKHKLLMLSRSYGITRERTLADIEVVHTGLSDEQMRAYVRDNLSPEQSISLLKLLDQHSVVKEIGHVPVTLEILCFLWKNQEAQASVIKAIGQGSLPGLYHKLTEYIWEHHYQVKVEEWASYVQKAKEACLPISDCEVLFDTLGHIALEAFKEGHLLISPLLVEKLTGRSFRKQLPVLCSTGFLLFQQLEGSGQYQFPHFTFQEYFSGRWLSNQLLSGKEEKREEAQDFFTENKYDPRYDRMFSFMAGEAVNHESKKQSFEVIRNLLRLANEGVTKDAKQAIAHLRLQMLLLNEWLSVSDEQEAGEGLTALEQEFPICDALQHQLEAGIGRLEDYEYNDHFPQLTKLLQDFRAVARLAAPRCLSVLLNGCNSGNAYTSRVCADTLMLLLPLAPAQSLEVFRGAVTKNVATRETAIRGLEELVYVDRSLTSKVCAILQELSTQDPSPDVRKLASNALSNVSHTVSLTPFDAQSWAQYFGDVGAAPTSPSSDKLAAILASPCPFWPGRRVGDTHLLVLIPAKVNNAPFTLDLLGELVKNPQGGGHKTEYRYYKSKVSESIGQFSPESSYWVLLTHTILPGSRGMTSDGYKSLLSGHVDRTGLQYAFPRVLEAATALLTHYVRSGERLYSDDPYTYTCCQEEFPGRFGNYHAFVGGFAAVGLDVYDSSIDHYYDGSGVAGCRKF